MTNQETTARSNKTIFINSGEKAVIFDYDKNEAHQLRTSMTSIDWMYIAPDDCEVRVKDKKTNKTIVYKANKDDIIILATKNALVKKSKLEGFIVSRYSKPITAIKLKDNAPGGVTSSFSQAASKYVNN